MGPLAEPESNQNQPHSHTSSVRNLACKAGSYYRPAFLRDLVNRFRNGDRDGLGCKENRLRGGNLPTVGESYALFASQKEEELRGRSQRGGVRGRAWWGMCNQAAIETANLEVGALRTILEQVTKGVQFVKEGGNLQDGLQMLDFMEGLQQQMRRMSGAANDSDLEIIEECAMELDQQSRTCKNIVQDLELSENGGDGRAKDVSLGVLCRVRPAVEGESSCLEAASVDQLAVIPGGNRKDRKKAFAFDRVFPAGASQEKVYSEMETAVGAVLNGHSASVFAYGQSGSGKSHTIMGIMEDDTDKGMCVRAMEGLLQGMSDSKRDVCNISVQIMQLHNECLRDLLGNNGTNGNIETCGSAAKCSIGCMGDFTLAMQKAVANAASGKHHPDRCHSIVRVEVTGARTKGCLLMVELAGSERVARSEATGLRLEEAKYINKSLSALGDVFAGFIAKSDSVFFGGSNLTQVLEDSLIGKAAKVILLLQVRAEEQHRAETLSTLMYGARLAKSMSEEGCVNKDKLIGAREAISKLIDEDPSRRKKILDKALAARSAQSDKENEAALRALKEELSHSRRSLREFGSTLVGKHARTMSISQDIDKSGYLKSSSFKSARPKQGDLRSSRSMSGLSSIARGAVSDMARCPRYSRGIARPYTGCRLETPFEGGEMTITEHSSTPKTGTARKDRSMSSRDRSNTARSLTSRDSLRSNSSSVHSRKASLARINSHSDLQLPRRFSAPRGGI